MSLKHITWAILLGAASCRLALAAEPPPKIVSLQGKWKPIDYGRFAFFPVESWTVDATTIVMTEGQVSRKFSYKLDPTVTPSSIDLTALDGPDQGKTYPGIVSLDGDYLEVCYDDRPKAKRPRVFATTSDLGGNRSFLFVKSHVIQMLDQAPQVRYSLKILGTAIHGYYKEYGRLPPAIHANAQGVPLTSWRLHLCPFMEQANVYRAFRLDEPWDSPANAPIGKILIKALIAPAPAKGPNENSCYQVLVGKGTPFPGIRSTQLPRVEWYSETILIVEAKDRVPWTKPEDLAYSEKKPLPPMGRSTPLGFHALMADGCVRLIRHDLGEKKIRPMIWLEKEHPVSVRVK